MPIQEVVKRLGYTFTSTGADKVAADMDKVGRAHTGVASASTSTERATLSLDRQFANIERRYDATIRAQQEYERVQRQVNAAVAQNPALQERANNVLALAEKQYLRATSANDNFTASQGLARHELINFSRQAQDVFVSLASGQRPMQVLIQQGAQIGDVFANSTGTFRGFLAQIRAMISPTLLLGAGVAALGDLPIDVELEIPVVLGGAEAVALAIEGEGAVLDGPVFQEPVPALGVLEVEELALGVGSDRACNEKKSQHPEVSHCGSP